MSSSLKQIADLQTDRPTLLLRVLSFSLNASSCSIKQIRGTAADLRWKVMKERMQSMILKNLYITSSSYLSMSGYKARIKAS
jgi:hypothetical protein